MTVLTKKMFPDPVCRFMGNILEVKLGSGMRITHSQVLEFSAHNNIRSAVSDALNTLVTPSIVQLSTIKVTAKCLLLVL